MKFLFLFLAVLILQGCAARAVSNRNENSASMNVAQPSPNNNSGGEPFPKEKSITDAASRFKILSQNQKFKDAPTGFQQIDFKNFSYPVYRQEKTIQEFIKLKNGEYKYREKLSGSRSYAFGEAFYIDLTSDAEKEAVVDLGYLSCGVSCDGGSAFYYVYGLPKGKPKLLWHAETGSTAYGCSTKSFQIKEKKIILDVFGQCVAKNNQLVLSDKMTSLAKFVARDTTRFVFGFDGEKFVQESREIFAVEPRSVMNYEPETIIGE